MLLILPDPICFLWCSCLLFAFYGFCTSWILSSLPSRKFCLFEYCIALRLLRSCCFVVDDVVSILNSWLAYTCIWLLLSTFLCIWTNLVDSPVHGSVSFLRWQCSVRHRAKSNGWYFAAISPLALAPDCICIWPCFIR